MGELYLQWEDILTKTQLFLVMLGMGTTLRARDFMEVGRNPRSMLFGLVGLILVSPLLAVAINSVIPLNLGVATGLVFVAVMPGGSFSNVFTYLGRGNVALSIALTSTMTFGCLFTIPLLLPFFAAKYVPPDFTMPVGLIIREVLLYMFLPLGLGMLAALHEGKFKHLLAKWCIRVGMMMIAVVVTGSLTSGRIEPFEYGWITPAAIVVYILATQQLSMLPFRFLHAPTSDRMAVGMELTVRNINLAIVLVAIIFPATSGGVTQELGNGVMYTVLFYGGASIILSMPYIFIYRQLIGSASKTPAEYAEPPALSKAQA